MTDNIHAVTVANVLAREPEPIPARVKWLSGSKRIAVYFTNRPGTRSERSRAKQRIEVAGYTVVSYRPGRGFIEPRLTVRVSDA